jgi:hypothetical protein
MPYSVDRAAINNAVAQALGAPQGGGITAGGDAKAGTVAAMSKAEYDAWVKSRKGATTTPAAAPQRPSAPSNPSRTPLAPAQPGTPAPVAPRAPNSNLPSDPVQAERGAKRPDYTLLDGLRNPGMSGARPGASSVLSAVYRLPQDGVRAARSLQAFNGKQGERLTLGR